MQNITLSNEVKKYLSKQDYYNEQGFINDAQCYIKAVESGRILYTVTSVSKSGMSRNINIKSFEGEMSDGYYRNYRGFLGALGYTFPKDGDDIRVGGCGMNMLFATNYNIIHNLKRMGFIDDNQCATLAQKVN